MMEEANINLKEALFKFIRTIFALNFEYIRNTIKDDILSSKSPNGLEMSFFSYFILIFGLRPGLLMNQEDVGFSSIKKI